MKKMIAKAIGIGALVGVGLVILAMVCVSYGAWTENADVRVQGEGIRTVNVTIIAAPKQEEVKETIAQPGETQEEGAQILEEIPNASVQDTPSISTEEATNTSNETTP